ncbi:MAG TPA: MFS transporter [Anaerolineae bacterium]|nr:MFS transporter [Anaerolineae bacterium]
MLGTDVRVMQAKYPDYVRSVETNFKWNFCALVLDGATFSFALALLSQNTILPYFLSFLTTQPFIIGLFSATYAFGIFFPQLLGARLVSGKRFRKRYVFWIACAERVGILFIALSAQWTGVLGSNLTLIVFFIAFGLFSTTLGLIGPAYGDFVAKNILRQRGLFWGALQLVSGGMGLSASLLAQRFLDALSFPGGFQWCFWIAFAFSFISLFFIANYREIPFPEVAPTEPLMQIVRSIPQLLQRQKNYRSFILSRSIIALGTMGIGFMTVYAVQAYQLSAASVANFTLILVVAQSASSLLWGWVGDHWGFKRVMEISALAAFGTMLMMFVSTQEWMFSAAFALVGGSLSATQTADPNLTYELAPPLETSRFIGVTNSILAPLLIAAPLIGGFLARAWSYPAVFVLAAALSILGFIATLTFFQEPRHPRANVYAELVPPA